ncbi:hypothetical protein BJV78DRAFT_1203610 [Lactifluus subvellereus]|nr:hypothetical protein BJV78DRAFT_1203610 [Lactifluus subvellereus]
MRFIFQFHTRKEREGEQKPRPVSGQFHAFRHNWRAASFSEGSHFSFHSTTSAYRTGSFVATDGGTRRVPPSQPSWGHNRAGRTQQNGVLGNHTTNDNAPTCAIVHYYIPERRGRGALSLLPWPNYHNNNGSDVGKEILLGGWEQRLSAKSLSVCPLAHAPPTHWHARVHSVVLFTRAQRNFLIVCAVWNLDYH